MYKLQFRCIRHEIYKGMIRSGKDMEDFPEEEFQEVYANVAKKFDKIRVKVYRSMFEETLTDELFAREFQLKAYCSYGETMIDDQSLIQLV